MNYYERHLGDYARDTAHLSILEHGVYTLLLDRYYATECGIPADQAHRFARARTDEEKAAVDIVLTEFFVLIDGIWISERTEKEIAKAQTKIKAARENGKSGGRPKKNQDEIQEKPTGLSAGSENETQKKAHQTPDTRHQTKTNTNNNTDNPLASMPTKAAAVCVSLRAEGLIHTNPDNPDLLALLAAGAEVQEFVEAARVATQKGKGFGYVLGIVKNQRQDAKSGGSKHAASGRGNKKSLAERATDARKRFEAEDIGADDG